LRTRGSVLATDTDLEFAEVKSAAALAVQLSAQSGPDPVSISAAMRPAFEGAMSFVTHHGLTMTGQPCTIYTDYRIDGVSFTVALPVAAAPEQPVEESFIRVDTLPALKTYRFTHHGPYANLGHTYGQIAAFMIERGWMTSEADWARYMPMWEEYMNDPDTTPPSELITHIYLPGSRENGVTGMWARRGDILREQRHCVGRLGSLRPYHDQRQSIEQEQSTHESSPTRKRSMLTP
jgi:effector-binding domain-containing protein